MHHEKTDTNTKYFILLRSSDDGACLGALHGGHDGRLLPGFLPVALKYFHLDLGMGVFILTSMSIGCNMMQIPVALLDRSTRNPRLISIGLLMRG